MFSLICVLCLTMAERKDIGLRELPFYTVSNIMLIDEFVPSKVKYWQQLEDNNFTKYLQQCLTQESIDIINCKYYDIDQFNICTKDFKNTMSLIHVNLQTSFKNFAVLKSYLDSLNVCFDIIAVSEAGRGNENRFAHIFGQNYMYFYNPPVGKNGGVACYVNKEFSPIIRDELLLTNDKNVDNVWVELSGISKRFVIGVLYRHPGYNTINLCDSLQSSLEVINKSHKIGIICGDMNIDLANPNQTQTKQYIETLLGQDCIPFITIPTRVTSHSATVIDHINILGGDKLPKKEIVAGNLFMEVADHLPNFIVIKDIKQISKPRPKIRIYSERKIAKFRSLLAVVDWEDVHNKNSTDVNACYAIFIDKYCSAFNEVFPEVKVSR